MSSPAVPTTPPDMSSGKLVTLDYLSTGNDALFDNTFKYKGSLKSYRMNIFNRQGSRFILPALFIGYGVAARFNQLPIRQFDFDVRHDRAKLGSSYLHIDTYLEIINPTLAYGLGVIPGVEARSNMRDRTLVMATSYLFMQGAVWGLKRTFKVERPRTVDMYWSELNSFPSGHMAVAMTGAHFLYKEYKDVSPWIGVGGYLVATATGALRIYNQAHWLSDVVMSAGIGLLSAELGYMLLPVWHSILGIRDGETPFAAVPQLGYGSLGLAAVYRF
jgi:membrane-associated phospholipid phosphatase